MPVSEQLLSGVNAVLHAAKFCEVEIAATLPSQCYAYGIVSRLPLSPMAFERQPITQRTYHDDFDNPDDRELVTWWHCGLVKSHKAGHQPKVLVCFRRVEAGNRLGEFVYRRIPVTELGQFDIGTIWKGKAAREELRLKVATFQLDFNAGAWRYRSVGELQTDTTDAPLPSEKYRLPDANLLAPSQVIQFPITDDHVGVLVPCLTFFSRCYGRSPHVKRALTTYPLVQAEDELFAPLVEPAPPNAWPINLRRRVVNADTVYLAHLRYDSYTKAQSRPIWGQLEAAAGNGSGPAFLRIGPWFEGPARVKAKGIWLIQDKRFLALQIIGCSEPGGVPIYRDRQNTNKTGPLAEGAEPGLAWQGSAGKVLAPRPIIHVSSEEQPDGDAASIEIPDRDFELLGIPRIVVDVQREHSRSSASSERGGGPEPDRFSGDDPQGRGKGVGLGSFKASTVMESNGVLRDIWNVLLKLKTTKPDLVLTVEFYTPSDGFSTAEEPRLIALEPFDDDERATLESRVKNWPLLDTKAGTPRGVLLARILTPKGHVHFFEIERRVRAQKSTTTESDEDGEKKGEEKQELKEESYKGMVFNLDDPSRLEAWLDFLLNRVRYACGVLDKLAGACPGRAHTFIHAPAKSESWPCERSVMHALEKLGIIEN